ncbi:hypothetical protein GCM10012275_04750 [Longimycelium tulufanense]|uniref:Uncharacterized protein n=1 Tax=Longimycelium tulufanense TaxID=907463 RepID=A0A8J3C9Z1_9PSEU|nr:hypothetical protein [Longimycelium tulufanense]GGM36609.1 hypothetical protein GCM10012275_04750 [Longimycelium tulufanense]
MIGTMALVALGATLVATFASPEPLARLDGPAPAQPAASTPETPSDTPGPADPGR